MNAPKEILELEIPYVEPKTPELRFKVQVSKVPALFCPYCDGIGGRDNGEEFVECFPCKGSGLSKK